jgi:hypothetical protein
MPSGIHKLSFLHVMASVVLVIGPLYWARAGLIPGNRDVTTGA